MKMENAFEKTGVISTINHGNEEPYLPGIDESDNESNEDESWKCVKSCNKTGHKFRTDVVYQEKLVYSVCIFGAFFVIGWGKGQFGPAYMDLRIISDTNLEQGSWILTSFFIGYSVGSVLQGFLHDRVNRKLMYSACLFVWSIIITGIPWCSVFGAMLFGYIMIGILQGILDTGGNTEILRVWEEKGRIAILRLNLIFALGSVLAPLVVAPFLMDSPYDRHIINFTTNGSYLNELTQNISTTSLNQRILFENKQNQDTSSRSLPSRGMNMLESNYSHVTSNERNVTDYEFLESIFESKSEIYIPFSLIAALSLVASVMFILSYVFYSTKKNRQTKKRNKLSKARKLSAPLKIWILSLISMILFFYCGIDEAYTAFLPTYCVEHFHWSKQDGAVLTSVVFISILLSRLITVVFERWIDTMVMLGINFVLMLISIIGLLIVSLYNLDIAVWFFAPLFGFSKSCLFALLFSWSNDYITPMTGHISACYFVTATLGCALNPILLGVLMVIDPVWYCYLFLIQMIIVLLLYVAALLLTKYIVRNYGKTYDAEPDIVKVGYAEEDKFIDRNSLEHSETSM